MSRWLKISLQILSGILLLIVMAWLGAAYYINHNSKAVLNTVIEQLNANVNGKIEVGGMETTMLKGFPGVSVSLENVELKDSLWQRHKHKLLQAKDIDVSLNIFSLILGKINIKKIGINEGLIYIYTDSTGYSNTSLFKSKEKSSNVAKNKNAFEVKRISLSNVDLIIDNNKRFKLFNFHIDDFTGKMDYPDSGWNGKLKVKTQVRSFAFNTKKGSFLKDKLIEGTLIAHYSKSTNAIVLDCEDLMIGSDQFKIGAVIYLNKNQSDFAIHIEADKILYKNIALLLSPNISSKLLKFAIDKPIDVEGDIIDHGDKNGRDPLINVKIEVKNNTVTIPSGQLKRCNFTGTFTNKDTAGKAIGDENSTIKFYKLSADYYNAPITVDTFTVSNLNRPVAAGLVKANFPLENLNSSIGGTTFSFKNGQADLSLYCKADIDNFRFTRPVISGKVAIRNADITYHPRNMKLVNSALNLQFNQKDLYITDSRFQVGKSILNMSCSIQNFLNFYYSDPSKILVGLKMTSPQLDLGEFMGFLGQRRTIRKKVSEKNAVKEVADQLNTVLEAARVEINLKVKRATYHRFIATNLNANIGLLNDGIYLNKMNVGHAGGRLDLSGNIKQSGSINKFNVKAVVSRVNVKEFFYAFENFGQSSITDQNIRGYLSAKVNASGSMTEKGTIVSRSIYGQVIFNLNKAALIGFDPLLKVQKLAFANRDFSNIAIDNLDGTLTLMGDKVAISPMQVNTSVLNFNMTGIYGITNGTNIAMDIPLRNPKKDENITDNEQKKLARMKGIVLHLKAIEEEGKLKIRWNKDHD